ncbi:MAG: cytochrome c [Deltaproteobacteria bacterium]|jgi:mono/diheme cytochrome c family protein
MSCQRIFFIGLFCLGLCIEATSTLAANPKQIIDDPTHIEAGRVRFAQNCAYCHGAQGSGGKHKKLQCRDFKHDYLFDVITNGMARGSYFMPPWDHFSEEKRWELVAYLQSLGKLEQCNG